MLLKGNSAVFAKIESFETVRDIYTGEKSPSDLIDYEIPEDSEFYIPQGGESQEITYQYTQAPIVDKVTQLTQAIAIVNAMTGNASLLYFMRPDLFPQITEVLSAMSTVMHLPQQNYVQSGNFANVSSALTSAFKFWNLQGNTWFDYYVRLV